MSCCSGYDPKEDMYISFNSYIGEPYGLSYPMQRSAYVNSNITDEDRQDVVLEHEKAHIREPEKKEYDIREVAAHMNRIKLRPSITIAQMADPVRPPRSPIFYSAYQANLQKAVIDKKSDEHYFFYG